MSRTSTKPPPKSAINGHGLVFLLWADSAATAGWCRHEDIDDRFMLCRSVGWVVAEDKDSITIAGTNGDGDGHQKQWHAPMVIPKCSIIERHDLGLSGKR